MLYFSTRFKTRTFAAMFQRCSVLDMKGKPSINGKRWAVKVV